MAIQKIDFKKGPGSISPLLHQGSSLEGVQTGTKEIGGPVKLPDDENPWAANERRLPTNGHLLTGLPENPKKENRSPVVEEPVLF